MKHNMINSFFLMVLVAIAGLQVSHAIRGHAVEDKIIKTVTVNPNIVQNLGADRDKDWVSDIVTRVVVEEFEEELEELDWTVENITPDTNFAFFRVIDINDLIDIRFKLRAIFEDALHVDLIEAFNEIYLHNIDTVGDLISAVKSALPKPKAN
ncbi:hypothetical protein MKW98_008129 [Papaver atlanticum]|uniref:Uncharacterized protein n=1 Tax=Papaver atlanticum TaxID=357466 RepID=A0AAD4SAA9_9MAGN|nr:hypothetical protein MKW98_008129 [Papaver atlanticum]